MLSYFKTFDGGNTWELPIIFPYEIEDIRCLRFYDASAGLVSANYGEIYKTSDGGSTWEMGFNNSFDIYDLEYLDENRVLSAGKFLYLSNDAGNTWEAMDIGNTHTLFDIFMLDESTDGGQTWVATEKPSTSSLTDLYFFDENNGLIFGNNGLIAKTETGGLVGFEESESLDNDNFSSIYPNPCQNYLTIVFNEKMNTGIMLTVKNLKSETLLHKQIPAMNGLQTISLNTTSLSPGTCFLSILAGKNMGVQKFVKLE